LRRSTLLVATALAATMSAAALPAQASPPPREHCVMNVDNNSAKECFESFRQAISLATNGRVTDAPESLSRTLADHQFTERMAAEAARGPLIPNSGAPAASGIVVMIGYDQTFFGGSSYIFTINSTCAGGLAHGTPNIGPDANDRITSVRSFANCSSILYEDDQFRGAHDSFGIATYVGDAMNNRTTSIQWFGVG
jgi:hypothetical protein